MMFSGVVRYLIQKCVVGGRIMTRGNKNMADKELEDLDGVSLYPSALNEMLAFLMGKQK